MKLGICERCGKPADAYYEIRSNKVYLVKFCPECGRTASLVTKDARKWRWKREIADFHEPPAAACSMDCGSCDHQLHTKPSTVAVDVTNLCNQNCPICLAYVDAMGFVYRPPVEYFDKIFRHFLHNEPKAQHVLLWRGTHCPPGLSGNRATRSFIRFPGASVYERHQTG